MGQRFPEVDALRLQQLLSADGQQAPGQLRTAERKTASGITDQIVVKEEGLSEALVYDRDERRSGAAGARVPRL